MIPHNNVFSSIKPKEKTSEKEKYEIF